MDSKNKKIKRQKKVDLAMKFLMKQKTHSVAEICKEYDISEDTFNVWKEIVVGHIDEAIHALNGLLEKFEKTEKANETK